MRLPGAQLVSVLFLLIIACSKCNPRRHLLSYFRKAMLQIISVVLINGQVHSPIWDFLLILIITVCQALGIDWEMVVVLILFPYKDFIGCGKSKDYWGKKSFLPLTLGCKYICAVQKKKVQEDIRTVMVKSQLIKYFCCFFFLKDYNKRYVVNHSLSTVELAKMMMSP